MAEGVFRRCTCGQRVPEGLRKCPRDGCTGTVKWAFVVDIGTVGARRQMHRSGFATKAEATAGRMAALTEMGAGTFVAPDRLTLGTYLDRWLAQSSALGWSPNTLRIRQTAVMHAKRRLAGVPLQQLTPDHFRDFFAWLLAEGRLRPGGRASAGPMAARSVASVYGSLRGALRLAVQDHKIRTNVILGTFRPAQDGGGSEEPRTWSLDELRAFLAAQDGSRDAPLWAVALATGMRRGELLGLRWRDVDLEAGRIDVRRQWTMRGERGWEQRALKTGTKALRTIEVDRHTIAYLERQRATVEGEQAAWGGVYEATDLVFPRQDGRHQDGSEVTKRFKRAIAQAGGLPVIVFHGTRHTHATLLLEDGVSLKVVAQRLGDQESTVLRTYSHVLPRGLHIAASRVESWLAPESTAVSDETAELRAQVRELLARLAAYEEQGGPAEIREQSVSEVSTGGASTMEGADVSS